MSENTIVIIQANAADGPLVDIFNKMFHSYLMKMPTEFISDFNNLKVRFYVGSISPSIEVEHLVREFKETRWLVPEVTTLSIIEDRKAPVVHLATKYFDNVYG